MSLLACPWETRDNPIAGRRTPRRAVQSQSHSVSVWPAGSWSWSRQPWTRQPANHRTKSWASGARGRWDIRMDVDQWIVDVDAVDGQVQCPVYTYFRRRTTGGRASDPPAHRASDSRHPLVPARTVQCILKYRTDLRSPLSAPRRIERDTVLRARKKGGRGPTASHTRILRGEIQDDD